MLREKIVERWFSTDESCPTILLANINTASNLKDNQKKIEEIVEIAHAKKVNIIILPEMCLTGFVWETDQKDDMRDYFRSCANTEIKTWLNHLKDGLTDSGDGLEYIIFNNPRPLNGEFYNTTYIMHPKGDFNEPDRIYDKIFLTPMEKPYFKRGADRRLILDTKWGKFGFLTCYDLCFVELARKYAFDDHVDAIITQAAWRSMGFREYPMMNVRTDNYYGFLWDLMNASKAAYNQVWSLGVNTVGDHQVSGEHYWGGSGVWTPSGMPLIQASNLREELIVLHHINIANYHEKHSLEFNYRVEFNQVYHEFHETNPVPVVLP